MRDDCMFTYIFIFPAAAALLDFHIYGPCPFSQADWQKCNRTKAHSPYQFFQTKQDKYSMHRSRIRCKRSCLATFCQEIHSKHQPIPKSFPEMKNGITYVHTPQAKEDRPVINSLTDSTDLFQQTVILPCWITIMSSGLLFLFINGSIDWQQVSLENQAHLVHDCPSYLISCQISLSLPQMSSCYLCSQMLFFSTPFLTAFSLCLCLQLPLIISPLTITYSLRSTHGS